MWELQDNFVLKWLGPYLAAINMPLLHCERDPSEQENDVPDFMTIKAAEEGVDEPR